MNKFYVTTYCNMAHKMSDGEPVDHECYILPPAALQAEIQGDYSKAIELIEAGKTAKVRGERSLPIYPNRR